VLNLRHDAPTHHCDRESSPAGDRDARPVSADASTRRCGAARKPGCDDSDEERTWCRKDLETPRGLAPAIGKDLFDDRPA